MNMLSVTARCRLGAVSGLVVLVLIAVSVTWLSGSWSAKLYVLGSTFLGGWLALLAIGQKSYETRVDHASRLEYWGESVWAGLYTILTGLGFGILMFMILKANGFDSPGISREPPAGNKFTQNSAADTAKDSDKTPKQKNQITDSVRKNLEETLKRDLEETLKKEMNEKFSFWGTLFAWLLAILALAVTVFIWSLQRSAQDIKERFDALDEYQEDIKQRFEKHHILIKSQEHVLVFEDLLEAARDNNPVFQTIRAVQGLILAARQVDSREFSAAAFAQRMDRLEGALGALSQHSSLDVTLLKPRTLAAALRTTAEYLADVGSRHWLPADWPATIHRLFLLAIRLEALV
ncbi:MAG TPA: hypothetical protein PKN13_11400 [Accumulibacter sp.]|nr:hypothetical protein [Accumulibacter sp.]HMW16957.1 hypothetical protein [Accumulibacter sp.]HMX22806.1 hypothetical protein [Accumulibacter sp.]HNC17209.1 hypothetical protein [Accumulibacter sp.]HND79733.1 hypothetical protein [Accumulibacter sp.]